MPTPEQHFARFRQHADAGALAAVFDALAPELLLVAAHVAPAGADAEDLVQATFLDAIEKAGRWDATRPLLPWLIGILVNHARVERRRRERKLDANRLPLHPEPSPLDALAAIEVAEQVTQALRSLPRQFRQTLTLRLVHGLTPTEIAHALGCPVATAKTRLQRGMDWLRKLLPAGISAGLAGALTTGRGLAAVRAAVLERARTPIPVAASTVAAGMLGGGLLMKKVVLAVVAVLCVAAFWELMPRPAEPAVADAGLLAGPTPVGAEPSGAAATTSDAPASAAGERIAVPTSAADTTGSAALEFVWKDDGVPAANLYVSWSPPDDGSASSARRADRLGRLLLADMGPGDYLLFGFKLHHRLTIRAGEATKERIEVEPSLRIDGVVVDGEGRGIASAAVWVQYFPDPEDSEPRLIASTRDDGTFRGATDRGGYYWAQKPGFGPSPCDLHLDGHLQLRLVLGDSGCCLRGVVFAADGKPATDARLTIVRETPRDRCPAPLVLHTDADCRFETRELTAGDHLLVAQAPGHAATPVHFTATTGIEQVVEVRLARGAAVVGSVRESTGAAVRAVVEMRPAWAGEQPTWIEALRPLYHLCVLHGIGDADGNYRIEHVPPGVVTLATSAAKAIVDARKEISLLEGEVQRCDFVLDSGNEIRGRVIDVNGAPLAGWEVSASPFQGGHVRDATSDAAGRFVLQGLNVPEYTLVAMPGLAPPHMAWVSAAGVRPGAGEVVLRTAHAPQDGGCFTGRILGVDGAPPPQAQGQVASVDDVQATGWFEVDAKGTFRVGLLPPGRYRLWATVAQGGIALGVHDLPARATVDLGTARLPASGTLELRLRTADGRAVEPVELSIADGAGNGGVVFERGADGIHRSKPLPAGSYTLFAWGEDFARSIQTVVVLAERATPVDVTVSPTTSVRFTFPRPQGTSAAVEERWGARVWLQLQNAAGKVVAGHMLSIDTVDAFVWTRGLPRGSYSFEAKAWPDGEPVRGSFEVNGEPVAQQIAVRLPAPGK